MYETDRFLSFVSYQMIYDKKSRDNGSETRED